MVKWNELQYVIAALKKSRYQLNEFFFLRWVVLILNSYLLSINFTALRPVSGNCIF